ncbi:MAG TPA: hypothetical protein VMT50_06030, partial [Steroidobacteraceae bacterium]|nr:hypothetical protein [Steroidobacteraceae bacterium]
MDPRTAAPQTKSPPPCLIVGCGYVGSRLARRLAGSRRIIGLLRTADRAAALQPLGIGVRTIDLDALEVAGAPLAELSAGATVVYLVPPPDRGLTDVRLARFLTALGHG